MRRLRRLLINRLCLQMHGVTPVRLIPAVCEAAGGAANHSAVFVKSSGEEASRNIRRKAEMAVEENVIEGGESARENRLVFWRITAAVKSFFSWLVKY